MFSNLRNRLFPITTLLILSALLFSACGPEQTPVTSAEEETVTTSMNPPSITTLDASEITTNSARLNAEVTSLGDSASVNLSFQLSTTPGNYVTDTPVQTISDTGEFTHDLNGLYAYMTYYYRVKVSGETATYGEEKSFTVLPEFVIDTSKTYTATIQTNFGDIVIELLPDEAPFAVNNFVQLSRQGYYKEVPFHRIMKDFMIQSGDPTGTGGGGPGYRFVDEPITREYVEGTLAMANAGSNTNGSQFFITLADLRTSLNKNYTIFGLVKEGFDIVQEIGNVPVTENNREMSKPSVEVFIKDIIIEEK